MADSSSVYKRIIDWNVQIIQPINELATNPPDGCDPLSPLPEAEKDHLWMKQDVINVQDKLMEICPDNDFTELETPQLITVILIEEIENAIAIGWCAECSEGEPCRREPEDWALGSWTVQKDSGTGLATQCCGIEIEFKDFLSGYTGWDVYRYTSPHYDVMQYADSNNQNWNVAQDTYLEARRASINWAGERRDELLQQRIVEQKAEELRGKRETLNILQAQLAACTANCDSIQTQIDQIEQEISILEDEIQEAKQKRDEYKQKAEDYSAEADAAATTNWSAIAALKSWDIRTINIVSDLISGIRSEWGMCEYPFNYRISTWGVGYTKWYAFAPSLPFTGNSITGTFTPSGLPYTKGGPLVWGGNWYKQWQVKHCCGVWDMLQGLCAVGECLDWVDDEKKSDLPTTHSEGDKLELKAGITHGTRPAEDYNPDPDA